MATKTPRLAVTLKADTLATIAKLALLQKRPRSAVVADLLEEMTPALQRIATLLEAAGKQRSKLPADTAARLNELETILGHIGTMGLDRLAAAVSDRSADSGTRSTGKGAQRPPGRRRPPVQ